MFPPLGGSTNANEGKEQDIYVSVSLLQFCKYIGGSATDSTKLRGSPTKQHKDSQGMYVTR
jgi:hypothetical protein